MNNRNQPCTCGSGKKFKKCCLPAQLHQKQLKVEANTRLFFERLHRARVLQEEYGPFDVGQMKQAELDRREKP